MKTVGTILEAKGNEIFSVAPDDSVYHALEVLADKNVGALVVTEGGTLVGIISERDYARKVILADRSSRDALVSEVMTREVETVTPGMSTQGCMEMMTDKHIRHLPVVDDGELVGVISIGDVVKAVTADLATMVDELESYIRGG